MSALVCERWKRTVVIGVYAFARECSGRIALCVAAAAADRSAALLATCTLCAVHKLPGKTASRVAKNSSGALKLATRIVQA